MLHAFVNGRILGDEHIEAGRAVLVEDGLIVDVVAADDARVASAQQHDLAGQLLLPGFIDTQVNGGGGVLFNDAPEPDSVRRIAAAHARLRHTPAARRRIAVMLSAYPTKHARIGNAVGLDTPRSLVS